MLRISFSLFQPLQTELQNRQISTDNRATALSVNAVIIDSVGADAVRRRRRDALIKY